MRIVKVVALSVGLAFLVHGRSALAQQGAGVAFPVFEEEREWKNTDVFARRGAAERGKMVKALGGNDHSEAAVAAGLKWLSLHQKPDGSWRFDHRHGPSKNNAGTLDAPVAATALTLLPFLGAGQTQNEGQYKQTVTMGLKFLVRAMDVTKDTAHWHDDGGLYSHGLATIAICEAYGITRDEEFKNVAQTALDYVVQTQEGKKGWRAHPDESANLLVTAVQVQALAAGHAARLYVDRDAFTKAEKFIDSLHSDRETRYGYASRDSAPNPTSAGLYCRALLGTRLADNEPVARRMAELAREKPDVKQLHRTFYELEAMRFYGTDAGRPFQAAVRDRLVAAQDKDGAERGSWYLDGDLGAEKGGRIYCTALAVLMLESPYRTYVGLKLP
jgi:hypothetical protein